MMSCNSSQVINAADKFHIVVNMIDKKGQKKKDRIKIAKFCHHPLITQLIFNAQIEIQILINRFQCTITKYLLGENCSE